MNRTLLTLSVLGVVGSFALVTDAEACFGRQRAACGCGATGMMHRHGGATYSYGAIPYGYPQVAPAAYGHHAAGYQPTYGYASGYQGMMGSGYPMWAPGGFGSGPGALMDYGYSSSYYGSGPGMYGAGPGMAPAPAAPGRGLGRGFLRR